uniref:Uncharacterized protein n=1 Tax=Chromera velia CCMP2878 TaxID=1169474 RepID=A0A0G4HRC4_9ALVE|eukprot:Cvel_8049.t1-p1 / transcript=Cvel_8049.t1 / gene=Cvel_8049 / organism=Chromera_velia_CCMP2878 / gene_product=hypothetical protein / transcript_product=hypothetical protein / location=Cvel_scaffold435:67606-68820(-) / protein_length=367 / sequence_SO=supercontig / SO=protein_coding / is_pseudo=false
MSQAVHEVKGTLRTRLESIVSQNYFLNIGPLFSCDGVSSVIRSFQAVSPKTLYRTVEELTQTGDKRDLELLLFVGADVNGLYRGVHTTLMRAVYLGSLVAVQLLVDAGADVNLADRMGNWAPVVVACRERRFAILKFLVSRGADLQAHHSQLQQLAPNMPKKVVAFLVRHGADLPQSCTADEAEARVCPRFFRCIRRGCEFLLDHYMILCPVVALSVLVAVTVVCSLLLPVTYAIFTPFISFIFIMAFWVLAVVLSGEIEGAREQAKRKREAQREMDCEAGELLESGAASTSLPSPSQRRQEAAIKSSSATGVFLSGFEKAGEGKGEGWGAGLTFGFNGGERLREKRLQCVEVLRLVAARLQRSPTD